MGRKHQTAHSTAFKNGKSLITGVKGPTYLNADVNVDPIS